MPSPTSTTPDVWWEASAGVYKDAGSTAASDGDAVQQWNDQSGNGKNATQATAGSRPIFAANVGGSAALSFDASRFMDVVLSDATGTFTWCAVVQFSGLTTARTIIGPDSGSGFQLRAQEDARIHGLKASSADMGRSTAFLYEGAKYLIVVTYDGSTLTFRVNGAAAGSVSSTQSFASSNVRIGANSSGERMNGYEFELLRYGSVLSGSEITALETYALSKYSITAYTTPTGGYTLCTFDGNVSSPGESLYVLRGTDGLTFSPVYSDFTAPSGGIRDPSVFKYAADGNFYVVYTAGNFGGVTYFGLAKSTDGITFTFVQNVSVSGLSGVVQVWAPEWFVDGDGSVHVLFAYSTGGNHAIAEVHPSTSDLSAGWSTPVAVTGSAIASDAIDPFVDKVGSTYYLWHKDESAKRIIYATSTALTSGYNSGVTGDWAGWVAGISGANAIEGASLLRPNNGNVRIYMDAYNTSGPVLKGLYYSEIAVGSYPSGTWSAPAAVTPSPPTFTTRHGTVIITASIAVSPATAERGQAGQTTTLTATGIDLDAAVAGDFSLDHGTITGYNSTTHVLTFTAWTSNGAMTLTHTATGATATITVSDTTAPNSPANLAFGSSSATYAFTFSWNAVSPSPSGETITYDVLVNAATVSSGQSGTTYAASGIADGDVLKVKAKDNSGNVSTVATKTFTAPATGVTTQRSLFRSGLIASEN